MVVAVAAQVELRDDGVAIVARHVHEATRVTRRRERRPTAQRREAQDRLVALHRAEHAPVVLQRRIAEQPRAEPLALSAEARAGPQRDPALPGARESRWRES